MRNQVNQVLYVFELVLAVLPCFRVVLYGFFYKRYERLFTHFCNDLNYNCGDG